MLKPTLSRSRGEHNFFDIISFQKVFLALILKTSVGHYERRGDCSTDPGSLRSSLRMPWLVIKVKTATSLADYF